MAMARTMFVTQDGSANALALNKDYNQVVIAGRNVFKVFNIEENEFVENCNLRVGKNLNLNFSCNHVVWNTIEDNMLATAATNGAVVLWNLSRPSRSKLEHVFSDHKRTVNKVCFHVTDPWLLISGSQDGTMKCFDLRTREVFRTFYSNSESVRDVQFSPHQHHIFAAVSENGNVQLWDLRRTEKYYQQYTAHSGPIFACDWHPEAAWLATASRDKTIRVWDLKVPTPSLEYTINTISSIGHIKWRPLRKYHIASCALVVDCSINVWDVRRPYIPFASFEKHKDVGTGIGWRGNPHTFLSTARDCTLYQHVFRDAIRPANSANPQGVAINQSGDVMYASRVTPTTLPNRIPGILKKQPTHSERFCHASSALHEFVTRNKREARCFKEAAKRYLLVGGLAELCEHNGGVARELGRHHASLVWGIVRALYSYQGGNKLLEHPPRGPEEAPPDKNGAKLPLSSCGFESDEKSVRVADVSGGADDETETDETPDMAFANMFKSVSEFQNEFQVQGDFFFGDGESDPLSMDQFVNSHPQELDWAIQSEAFPLRQEIQEGAAQPELTSHRPLETELDASTLAIEQLSTSVTVSLVPGVTPINPSQVVVEALRYHADLGDVQTPVTVLFALGDKRRELALDPLTQEHWILTYIDLLGRHRLWDVSAQIIQLSWMPSISQLSQQSTTIHTCCGACNKPLVRTGWLCDRCRSATTSVCSVCSVCHQVVRGLYSWCQGCGHGGHLAHCAAWFAANRQCPTGCGHICEYG